MVVIHLSDEAVKVVEGNDPPGMGQHIEEEYLEVLRQVALWRVIKYPNQIVLPVPIPYVYELERVVSHLKANSPMPEFANVILVTLKTEIGNTEKVSVPRVASEEAPPLEIFGPSSINVASEYSEEE